MRLTLVGVLILLVGDLVRPRSHLRNSYIYWSRCSVEALPDCIWQVLVGDRKGGWRRGVYELEGGMEAWGEAILSEVAI